MNFFRLEGCCRADANHQIYPKITFENLIFSSFGAIFLQK